MELQGMEKSSKVYKVGGPQWRVLKSIVGHIWNLCFAYRTKHSDKNELMGIHNATGNELYAVVPSCNKKKHVFAVDRIGSTPILANTGEDSTCTTQLWGVGGGENSSLLFYSVKTSLFVGKNHGLINYKDTKTNRP